MEQDKQEVECTQKIRHSKSYGSKIKDFIPHSRAGNMMFMFTSILLITQLKFCRARSSGRCWIPHTQQACIPAWVPSLGNPKLLKGTVSKPVQPLLQRERLFLLPWKANKYTLYPKVNIIAICHDYLHTFLKEIVGNKCWYKSCRNTRNPWRIISYKSSQ